MRFRNFSAGVALLLAGCFGTGSQLPPQAQSPGAPAGPAVVDGQSGMPNSSPAVRRIIARRSLIGPGWILPAAKTKALLYVADEYANAVYIYPANHGTVPIGQITNGMSSPSGLAVDAARNLYVTDIADTTVKMYPPGGTSPTRVYSQDTDWPVADAVGSDGTLYVANYGSGTQYVAVFPAGGTTPSMTIPIPGYPDGVALDASNNLYVAYLTGKYAHAGRIMKFRPGSTKGKDLGIKLMFSGGLSFDNTGNLVVCNPEAHEVDVFPPGSTTPSLKIDTGFNYPYTLAFDKRQNHLYVGDVDNINVQEDSYPGGTNVNTIGGLSSVRGVALSPASPQ